MTTPRTYTGHRAYRRNRARLLAATDTCALCGQALHPDLPAGHPMSATADHIVPISRGGTHAMNNLRAAHFACNSRRGNRNHMPGQPTNLGRTW